MVLDNVQSGDIYSGTVCHSGNDWFYENTLNILREDVNYDVGLMVTEGEDCGDGFLIGTAQLMRQQGNMLRLTVDGTVDGGQFGFQQLHIWVGDRSEVDSLSGDSSLAYTRYYVGHPFVREAFDIEIDNWNNLAIVVKGLSCRLN
jgi:hypothetical protein